MRVSSSGANGDLSQISFISHNNTRLVAKDGQLNISTRNVPDGCCHRYTRDLLTSLLSLSWGWYVVLIVGCYVGSWLIFAVCWFAMALAYTDWTKYNNDSSTSLINDCLIGVDDFTTALLLSIETQQTIGYGVRAPTRHCPESVILVIVQSLVGAIVSAFIGYLIFARYIYCRDKTDTES